jgi:hypothetical protein
MFKRLFLLTFAAGAVLTSAPAFASFHLMQIQQVIGGVGGDKTIQAIQLRLRSPGQNFVSQGRIRAWDAAGANPVTIIDMLTDVSAGAAGKTVLVVSPNFASTFPGVPGDFTMTAIIPASYLAAGKLTYEADSGFIYWGLAWGGAAYTGTNTSGDTTNDADGNFNPPFASALPFATGQALLTNLAIGGPSTNNAANYAITAGDATFTNNAGASDTVPLELQKFDIE